LRNFRRRVREFEGVGAPGPRIQELVTATRDRFKEAMDSDLNTSEALAAVFDFRRDINTAIDAGEFSAGDRSAVLELIEGIDSVLGILGEEGVEMLNPEVDALIEERNQARRNRNFARADEIRNQLSGRGIILEDTPQGTKWKRK
jgi:cysteinyl-tRNA synthetase